MPLTDVICRQTKPGSQLKKISDGGGLQLWIRPSGTRSWHFAYRHAGKQKMLILGAYPTVPLAEAREQRNDAKKVLRQGGDPGACAKSRSGAGADDRGTFKRIALEFVEKHRRE